MHRFFRPPFLASVGFLSFVSAVSSASVVDVGTTVPLWTELKASVNADGSVAYGTVINGQQRASVWANGARVDLHALCDEASSATARSYAFDITDSENVVGYLATTSRETDRVAYLWSRVGGTWAARSLHASLSPTPRQSAAYAVSERGTTVRVGGYVREAISASTLSRPVIWNVTPAQTTVTSLPLHGPAKSEGYGIVYGIQQNAGGTQTWACGGSGVAAGQYQFATCWSIAGGSTTMHLLTDVGPGSGYASSVINRVRELPTPNGGVEVLAVGTATATNGAATGFAYNLTTGVFAFDFAASEDSDSMLLDVARHTFPGSASPHEGRIFAGVGTSYAGATGAISSNPWSSDISTLFGLHRTTILDPLIEGDACNVLDVYPLIDTAAIVSLSREGRFRLLWAEGRLYRADTQAPVTGVSIPFRQATVRTSATTTETVQHYQFVQHAGSPAAAVYWASKPGCALVPLNGGACEAPTALSGGTAVPLSTAAGKTQSAVIDGPRPSAQGGRYLQTVTTAQCRAGALVAIPSNELVNPKNDLREDFQWYDCDGTLANGYETDVRRDIDHCGQCGVTADDGFYCTTDSCQSGVVTNVVMSNQCLLPVGGAKQCFAGGDTQPIASGGELASNFCSTCAPASSQTAWTPTVNACCASGQPLKDGWESGYRPAKPNNVPYTNTSGMQALSATWIRRLTEIHDGQLWSWQQDDGLITGKSCMQDSGVQPHVLTSYLNGTADQEDWFVFRHADKNGAHSKMSEPRVRLLPNAATDLELCVYPRCVTAGNTGSLAGMRYMRNGSVLPDSGRVSSADSPLHDGVRGLDGYCVNAAGLGGAEDIRISVESSNGSNGVSCWNVDVFVQVKARPSPQSATCQQPYKVMWGNDKHVVNAPAVWGGPKYRDTTCTDCCDGHGALVTP